MALFFNKFKDNPFVRISCTDYLDLEPFIERNTSVYLKQSVLQTCDSQWSLHVVVRGERGSGKTSHLLYAGKLIRDKRSSLLVDDYIRGVADVFKSPFHIFRHMLERLNIPHHSINIPTGMMDFQKALREVIGERKYFFLVDVPDSLSKKNLNNFVNSVEYLIGIHKISIIIAMNISHFEKSFSYSEVLGKFHPAFIKLFTPEDTAELVERRLKTVSINNDTNLFTDDAIGVIHRISGGIPRLMLTKCDTLFKNASTDGVSIVDYSFAEKILEKTHLMDTLNQRVSDGIVRQSLLDVFNVLKNDLGGEVGSQKDYIEKVKEKGLYNNHITIIKKIKELEKLRLITIERDRKDMKSKIIRCVI